MKMALLLFLSSIYNTLEPQNSISIDCKEFSLSWLCPLKLFSLVAVNGENEGYLSDREINKYFSTMCLLLRVEFLSMSRSKAAQSACAPGGRRV